MQIEFIGLPGAGKTTLRRKLLSSLQQDDEARFISSEEAFLQISKRNIDRFLRYPLNFLPHSGALKFAGKLINRSKMQFEAQNRFLAKYGAALSAFLASDTYLHMSRLDKQRVIGNFLSTGSLWQCTHTASMNNKVIFFEEGLVQKSFMFVDHSRGGRNEVENISRYLESIPTSDLVIHVSASIQTSWDRMLGRADGLTDRLRDADKETIGIFLKASQAHLDAVTGWLTDSRQENLLVLDSESKDTSEFEAIKDRIRQL